MGLFCQCGGDCKQIRACDASANFRNNRAFMPLLWMESLNTSVPPGGVSLSDVAIEREITRIFLGYLGAQVVEGARK